MIKYFKYRLFEIYHDVRIVTYVVWRGVSVEI